MGEIFVVNLTKKNIGVPDKNFEIDNGNFCNIENSQDLGKNSTFDYQQFHKDPKGYMDQMFPKGHFSQNLKKDVEKDEEKSLGLKFLDALIRSLPYLFSIF